MEVSCFHVCCTEKRNVSRLGAVAADIVSLPSTKFKTNRRFWLKEHVSVYKQSNENDDFVEVCHSCISPEKESQKHISAAMEASISKIFIC